MGFKLPANSKEYRMAGQDRPFAKLMEGFGLRCSLCWDVDAPGWHGIVRSLVAALRADGWDGEISDIRPNDSGRFNFEIPNPTPNSGTIILVAQELATKTCRACGRTTEPGTACCPD